MSHNPQETIICPNCGYHATYNYCAECGQETHLHKDTFFGLIGHFVSHYFHYDSKFWKTMKLLWFHPGALTIAYWKKQRNRFIPPISLYIFISFVFFFCVSVFSDDSSKMTVAEVQAYKADSIKVQQRLARDRARKSHTYASELGHSLANTGSRLSAIEYNNDKELSEKLLHMFPKLFFFMIPLMAFVLKLLFFRRKDIYFVDHAVFSLHYHSFWFSAMLLPAAENFGSQVLSGILFLGAISTTLIYLIIAIKRAYRTGWLRSVLYALTISIVYSVFLLIVFLASITYLFNEVNHAVA